MTAARLRVLVLGGHGWLGGPVVEELRRTAVVEAPRSEDLDLRDAPAVLRSVRALRPDVVVNLAARMPPSARPEMDAVNVAGARSAAAAAAECGARLVHMSSDLVLDGRAAPYADDAPAAPLNDYGHSKAEGERAVLAAHPAALVLRTSLVVDPGVPDRFSRGCLERAARGEPFTLFEDEIRSAITRSTLARAVAELAVSETGGFLNVAGTEGISRHELGTLLLPRFGLRDLSLVRRGRASDHTEPRPLDLRLDVRRARSILRTPLRSIREELGGSAPNGR